METERRKSGLNLPSGMSQTSLRLDTYRSTSNNSTPLRSNLSLSSPRSVSSPRSITSLSAASSSPTSKSICSDRFIPCRSSSRLHAFRLIEKPSPKNSNANNNNSSNNKEGGNEAYTRLLKQELFGPDFGSPFSSAGNAGSAISPNKNIFRFKTEYSSPKSPFSPSALGRDCGVPSEGSTPPKPPRKVPKTPHKVFKDVDVVPFCFWRLFSCLIMRWLIRCVCTNCDIAWCPS